MRYLLQRLLRIPAIPQQLTAKETLARHENVEFIRAWTHDIGNLIGMMKGAIDLLPVNGNQSIDEDTIDLLKFGCQMLTDINENIVAFHQKGIEIAYSDFELTNWLESLVKAYRFVAQPRGIEIKLDIDKEVPAIINSDQLKLSQVLINLLLNAIKFSEKGKLISLIVYGNKNRLYFTVSDQGMGIAANRIKDIFQPYIRLNKGIPGMGLGLHICNRIVIALGGHITVHSTVGKGTTFTVIIPVVQPEEVGRYHSSPTTTNDLAK